MENNSNHKKQNRSMFLYTALIFAVALVLIIIAFFGQTNISNLRRSTENANNPQNTPEAAATSEVPPAMPTEDAIAQLGNAVSSLEAENKTLKEQITAYEALISANAHINDEDYEAAAADLELIDTQDLTDEQKILYEQLNEQVEARKEQ